MCTCAIPFWTSSASSFARCPPETRVGIPNKTRPGVFRGTAGGLIHKSGDLLTTTSNFLKVSHSGLTSSKYHLARLQPFLKWSVINRGALMRFPAAKKARAAGSALPSPTTRRDSGAPRSR